MVSKKNPSNKKFFYAQGSIIAFLVLITGLVMDLFLSPPAILIPAFPKNLFLLIVLLAAIIVSGILLKNKAYYALMSSAYTAVPALAVFTLLVVLMGLIPQHSGTNSFLNGIKSSWTFYLAGFYLVVILMYATGNHIRQFNTKNICFVLNHLGVIVILIAGGVKPGDYQDYTMTLKQGEPVWYATDRRGNTHELDFALEMKDFILEQHPPLLEILSEDNASLNLVEIKTDAAQQTVKYEDLSLVIDTYLGEATDAVPGYKNHFSPDAVSAIRFHVFKNDIPVVSNIWIDSGNAFLPPTTYTSGGYTIRLNKPMPKQYTTKARLYKKGEEPENINISVNHPAEINGWKLYQQSYNTQMGKYTAISVLNLTNDPWLPVMYFGFFLLMAGMATLFFKGKPKTVL